MEWLGHVAGGIGGAVGDHIETFHLRVHRPCNPHLQGTIHIVDSLRPGVGVGLAIRPGDQGVTDQGHQRWGGIPRHLNLNDSHHFAGTVSGSVGGRVGQGVETRLLGVDLPHALELNGHIDIVGDKRSRILKTLSHRQNHIRFPQKGDDGRRHVFNDNQTRHGLCPLATAVHRGVGQHVVSGLIGIHLSEHHNLDQIVPVIHDGGSGVDKRVPHFQIHLRAAIEGDDRRRVGHHTNDSCHGFGPVTRGIPGREGENLDTDNGSVDGAPGLNLHLAIDGIHGRRTCIDIRSILKHVHTGKAVELNDRRLGILDEQGAHQGRALIAGGIHGHIGQRISTRRGRVDFARDPNLRIGIHVILNKEPRILKSGPHLQHPQRSPEQTQ